MKVSARSSPRRRLRGACRPRCSARPRAAASAACALYGRGGDGDPRRRLFASPPAGPRPVHPPVVGIPATTPLLGPLRDEFTPAHRINERLSPAVFLAGAGVRFRVARALRQLGLGNFPGKAARRCGGDYCLSLGTSAHPPVSPTSTSSTPIGPYARPCFRAGIQRVTHRIGCGPRS